MRSNIKNLIIISLIAGIGILIGIICKIKQENKELKEENSVLKAEVGESAELGNSNNEDSDSADVSGIDISYEKQGALILPDTLEIDSPEVVYVCETERELLTDCEKYVLGCVGGDAEQSPLIDVQQTEQDGTIYYTARNESVVNDRYQWSEDGNIFEFRNISSELGYVESSESGLEMDGNRELDDYYSEKVYNHLTAWGFNVEKRVNRRLAYLESNKEEYVKCTFSRAYKGIPVLNGYYYINDEGSNVYTENLTVDINARGIIGLHFGNLVTVVGENEKYSVSDCISFEEAAQKVDAFLKEDKEERKRLVVQDGEAVYISAVEEESGVLMPAWYIRAYGSVYYERNGLTDSEGRENCFAVNMVTGEVHEIYEAE